MSSLAVLQFDGYPYQIQNHKVNNICSKGSTFKYMCKDKNAMNSRNNPFLIYISVHLYICVGFSHEFTDCLYMINVYLFTSSFATQKLVCYL